MFDIYTNRIPFGLLTGDERAALKAHPGPWEYWSKARQWIPCGAPYWFNGDLYRAVKPAPEPLWIAPEVWAVLDKQWQWAARDKTGMIYSHGGFPTKSYHGWENSGDDYLPLSLNYFAPHLVRPGTVAWDQSLIQRPEGV
jgi:hypothetical protein